MTRFAFAAPAALIAVVAASPVLGDIAVSIPFTAEIAGKPFSCSETFPGLGSTGAAVQAVDFRLFVSEAALVRADGSLQPIALDEDGQWQQGSLALLDFEDGSGGCANGTVGTNTTLRGTVPEGDYTGLALTIGVPFAQNHGDPTVSAAPLNTTAMFWNWQGGYKFLRIDLVPTALAGQTAEAGAGDGKAKGWFLHLGSTLCDAASKTEAPKACANENRMAVRLDGFDPARNTVVIDPGPVLAEADLTVNAPETSPGCMSFPKDADCLTVMGKLGLPYMDRPAGPQQLVSMR